MVMFAYALDMYGPPSSGSALLATRRPPGIVLY